MSLIIFFKKYIQKLKKNMVSTLDENLNFDFSTDFDTRTENMFLRHAQKTFFRPSNEKVVLENLDLDISTTIESLISTLDLNFKC